ncbi:REST corepressor spr-1 [Caenorhabditis elegans]|uniref:REST corepressor spr-1 n=1 Tax=Caenorhabditis elegans TaxID=6239 RepID=RCORB_CAEEL|nr:REST corepressor spr-1 [Caenorhabditis elegans]Q18919.2 RecName: Full=REST corepressor spr-1; AltName: Full=CoREST; AltName: Full=Suppressor of presenilin 1 [Caenorhabditis elegans]AAN59932.1 suppressor of presenilin defect [Caenorhabditis elegans]AAN62581.1 suppressor of presenilin 1 [Caenorhabditis elegans]CCD68316.1 REST corepressor spr-1 [Caenorhabditis elegans]|eukprot:NP_505098.1 REST corepressor spr-1 [Caenorhabditis elegans]
MDLYDDDGESAQSEKVDVPSEESTIAGPETDIPAETIEENVPEVEENTLLEEDSLVDVDSPRPSQQRSKPSKSKRKRKRSSSGESSAAEPEIDAGAKVKGPLSNTNKEINVGTEFQAKIADLNLNDKACNEDRDDQDELIWNTPETIDDEKLEAFIRESSDRYLIPIDRALYILTINNFNFDSAIAEVARRNELKDVWTDQEITLFENCYQIFGKNFSQIRSALCHRSLQSIVQFYYESKKRVKYLNFVNSKCDDSSSSEETETPSPYPEAIFESMCDNCGEKAENMQINNAMNRPECRACLIYFNQTGVPRPTSLRLVLAERIRNQVSCPDNMKEYMKDFDKLSAQATGSTFQKRIIVKDQCVEYIIDVDKIPSSSCTENGNVGETSSPSAQKTEIQSESDGSGPLIWRHKKTVCMEEIEVLADDSRRKMFEACQHGSKVDIKLVASWKNDMTNLRKRVEQTYYDPDLNPTYLFSHDRVHYSQDWTQLERSQVIRCFNMYGAHFEHIADVIGTKTPDQVYQFYLENQKAIDAADEEFLADMKNPERLADMEEEEDSI